MIRENTNTRLSKALRQAAIAVVAIGIAAVPAVHAKSKKTADEPANVVAHVQFSGGPVTRMLLVRKNGKEYLFLGLESSTKVAILDVSEPDQPRAIDTAQDADGAPAAEVKVVAETLKIFGTSDAGAASSSTPKEIRTLSGVTAFMKNRADGLIYVANGDGLWIIKTKQRADADSETDYYGGGG